MNLRLSLTGIALVGVCSAILLCGCGRTREWVSQREYFNTAFASGERSDMRPEFYGYVEPQERTGTVRIREPRATGGTVLRKPDGDPYVTIRDPDPALRNNWDDNELTPRERSAFTSDVHNELQALARELERVKARAHIKGAAAEAAVEPGVRDFDMSLDILETKLNELDDARDIGTWKIAAVEVRSVLNDAAEAVHEADEAVDRVPVFD